MIAVASIIPGSLGGYKAQLTEYNEMGRAKSSRTRLRLTTAGSRPATTPSDGNSITRRSTIGKVAHCEPTTWMALTKKRATHRCGCAGGEVVTLTDEVGRQQKVYADVLGRQWKTQILNWDGNVYSTTTNTLNARDQVTLVRQWAGAENGSGAYQDTTMSYDGYGRMQTKHIPEQNAGTATVYAYNHDDTIQSVTDARGASATYGYNNNRHLVNEINYSAPAGITPTPNVTFGYDAAGNRTSMTDGLGSVSYSYNQLSRMTGESRVFNDPSNPAINGTTRSLLYDYNVAGQLKSVTDPFNATINYTHDSSGRLGSVTGTNFAGVTTYATSAQYRAWGALKSLTYGNTRTLSASYNSRLQAAGISGVIFKVYQYYADGNLRYSKDLVDDRFDRSYAYDHTSRIQTALSGPEARGEPDSNNRPYQQSLSYDAFNHLTSQTGTHWSSNAVSNGGTFTNNRRTDANYDAEGNVLSGLNYTSYTYNSAGQIALLDAASDTTQSFDGNGLRVKTSETAVINGQATTEVTYYVRSTVLGGQVLTEMNSSGGKQRTFVYAGGQVLAWQRILSGVERVTWEHRDPSNASFRTTNEDGTMNDQTSTGDGAPAELDPTGGNADVLDPYLSEPPPEENQGSLISYGSFGDVSQLGTTYWLDGIPMPADELFQMVNTHLHGRFGIVDWLARESDNDANYQSRWSGPRGDGRWVTTALPISSPWTVDWNSFAQPPQNPLKSDVGAARAKVENDNHCREALNKVLARARPDGGSKPGETPTVFLEHKFANGRPTSMDIFDGLDRVSSATVVDTGKSGVTRSGSVEYINDLSVDTGGSTIYKNSSYATRSREEKIFAILHEALHMFSGFTDRALAVAAQRASGFKEGNIDYFGSGAEGQRKASLALNDYIRRNCKGLSVGGGTTYSLGP